ncbi:uncharacterized protein [Arachis hypogaea]|uniref:uncharacterized protein isoform X2 n=2 Tax=Arachis TaxID=3817 RepID=UPI003B2105DE
MKQFHCGDPSRAGILLFYMLLFMQAFIATSVELKLQAWRHQTTDRFRYLRQIKRRTLGTVQLYLVTLHKGITRVSNSQFSAIGWRICSQDCVGDALIVGSENGWYPGLDWQPKEVYRNAKVSHDWIVLASFRVCMESINVSKLLVPNPHCAVTRGALRTLEPGKPIVDDVLILLASMLT